MNSVFRRTLMCGAIALGMGGSSIALAQDTPSTSAGMKQAGPDTSAAPSASPSSGTSGTGTSSGAGTSSTTGTSSGTGTSTGTTGTTNGSAMPAERPAAASSTGANSPARRVFDQLDTNHDGALSFEEFSRATISPK